MSSEWEVTERQNKWEPAGKKCTCMSKIHQEKKYSQICKFIFTQIELQRTTYHLSFSRVLLFLAYINFSYNFILSITNSRICCCKQTNLFSRVTPCMRSDVWHIACETFIKKSDLCLEMWEQSRGVGTGMLSLIGQPIRVRCLVS